jgi:hypothetical protein
VTDDCVRSGFGAAIRPSLATFPDGRRRQRAGHHTDHRLGYELLLPRGPGGSDRQRTRLVAGLRVPGLHRFSSGDGTDLDDRRAPDRQGWRTGDHVAGLHHRRCRALPAVTCDDAVGVSCRLGADWHRHAMLPLRCSFCGSRTGRTESWTTGDLLSDALRGVRILRVLGRRTLSRGGDGLAWLSAYPCTGSACHVGSQRRQRLRPVQRRLRAPLSSRGAQEPWRSGCLRS